MSGLDDAPAWCLACNWDNGEHSSECVVWAALTGDNQLEETTLEETL